MFITKWSLTLECKFDFALPQACFRWQRSLSSGDFSGKPCWSTEWCRCPWKKVVDESLDRLAQVFQCPRKPSRCHWLQEEVLFLGHVVNCDGICPNPALVEDVRLLEPLSNLQNCTHFMGCVATAASLFQLEQVLCSSFTEPATPFHGLLKKGATFLWTDEHPDDFTQLKERLTTAPVLGYPAAEFKYIFDTDHSNSSIGVVLSQVQWEEEWVFTFTSSHLTPAQRRYCVTRLKLLAVVHYTWQFCHYLLSGKFLLWTDHSSFTWLFQFKCPEDQLARWLEELSQYDFYIKHRAGCKHSSADTMSREPGEILGQMWLLSSWKELVQPAMSGIEVLLVFMSSGQGLNRMLMMLCHWQWDVSSQTVRPVLITFSQWKQVSYLHLCWRIQ